jgi:hypothetical protein
MWGWLLVVLASADFENTRAPVSEAVSGLP